MNRFISEFKTRWTRCHRKEERFFKTHRNWLDSSISFFTKQLKRGRKEIAFEESGPKTKYKKTKDLRDNTSLSMLAFATQVKLRESGNIGASKLVHDVASCSPTRADKYRKSLLKSVVSNKLSSEEALAVLVEAGLSRHQYNIVKQAAPERFPSYTAVQLAKKQCYPKSDSMRVCESSVELDLQALLNHTVERLVLLQNSVIDSLNKKELSELCLYTKWGFDGSSGHSSYKQAFHGTEATDSSVLITSIVPLRLECGEKIIWQNPRPSSTRFCRPLKIEFIKETAITSKLEHDRVSEEIKHLNNSTVELGEKVVVVRHSLILSMIDGKVCNALTETTSTQKCYLCGSTSKDFNQIDKTIKKEINTDNLQFGLSILHGWIRFFECLLHLSYKLPIKKWQARSDSEKQIVEKTKAEIQKQFKERTGLIVDCPKPGFGSSNDGNTARRFFQNAELSAEITKINVNLIVRMHNILIVVSCGHDVNVHKFREYAHETARIFVEHYPWYYMPPTLHKFFIHGPEIIAYALLPIGQLSEEAQEASNKNFKKYRESNSRKMDREKSNQDVFNMMLITSDPIISSRRKLPEKKLHSLPKVAVDMLQSPSLNLPKAYARDNNSAHGNDSDEEDGDDDSNDDA
ncbi:PREDICTED: uncharacterized protein LOC108364163 [Rhagoletis zephyria]|uniref:uncharacterized protein LOC108364163 n=1 Tax=Rhagoletis zephyria TaxID=28612 RepID=UPI0008113B5D|nr:PREDICTED: uncharacterized protein LOC108364163 [Rhagoletis zephyria]